VTCLSQHNLKVVSFNESFIYLKISKENFKYVIKNICSEEQVISPGLPKRKVLVLDLNFLNE